MEGMGRILALDVGERRIGVAVSDPASVIAQPLEVLTRTEEAADVARLAALADEYECGTIVVGLPVGLRGQEGPAAERVRAFADRLQAATQAEIVLWDERLTTVEATRAMREDGRDERWRRGVVDKVAAAIILRSYLEARARGA
jgi:putative Holliday junction resolvase